MRIKRIVPLILAVVLLTTVVIIRSATNGTTGESEKEKAESEGSSAPFSKDIRGVWVTYMTLDIENEMDKEAAFDTKIDTIISDMKAGGFNTMIVQVHPFCDALYESEYYPWSHIISGEQGVDPGFDPLEHIIKKCRRNDIAIHAWLNPYRIRTESTPSELSEDHPYVQDESIGVEIGGRLYLDPTSDKTIELISSGIAELVENYDIDGIQFDDYFYPENCGDFDADDYASYLRNSEKPITLEEFRRNNVNRMVRASYEAAHQSGRQIEFGISPQGNIANNANLYADVKTWCADEGYVDYICPQIYFSLDNPAMKYEDCLNEWLELEKHDGLRLYIGLAGYKAGTEADDGTWLDNDDILTTEIAILRNAKTDGFILFSYDSFHHEKNQTEIKNVTRYLKTLPMQKSSDASSKRTS